MSDNIHRQVWRIAFPMILANISVPLLGIVDTAVVGHLDSPRYIGAVSVGASIFGIVFWGFGFLRMGTTGLTAQAFGANDYNEIRAILVRAILVALGLALLLIIFQWLISAIAFGVIQATQAVEQQAQVYFNIRIYSAPASLINYAILGWFLGMQNARIPLILVLLANVANMIMDYVLVVHYEFSTGGVAVASVIAEYLQLVGGMVFVKRALLNKPGCWRIDEVFDALQIRRTLVINTDIFIRTLCLMFSLAYFVALGAKFGDTVLAANAVLFNFQLMTAHGLDGFAHSAEALVGRCIGQKNKSLLKRIVWINMQWAFFASVILAVCYFFFGYSFIQLMTNLALVQAVASNYQPWVVLLPLVSVWAFVFDGIFIGALWSKPMRNIMLIATFAIYVPASYAFSAWGNHGLWMAFVLFFLSRSCLMGWEYRRRMYRIRDNCL